MTLAETSKVSKRLCSISWKRFLLVIFIAVILIYTCSLKPVKVISIPEKVISIPQEQIYLTHLKKVDFVYLINTSTCRIPHSNPYNDDIAKFLKNEKPYKCSKHGLLSYIDKSNEAVTLNINQTLLKEYSIFKIKCCYSNITRIVEEKCENDIKLTPCVSFEYSTNISYPFVKVQCTDRITSVYENVHATTLPVPPRIAAQPNRPKFSVLLLGIDSMSKPNIIRTMPKTYRYVEKEMLSLKGYNKVGDNTFPNLMAVLTGYNLDQLLDSVCSYDKRLNKCPFIWDKFREAGYVTGYAEDEIAINTFNFDRPGFAEEPTDFYYRPYFLAAEKLKVKKRHEMTYCAGPETSGERLLNAAKDFAISFQDKPSFGLFWANSFSHDDVNMASVMDEAVFRTLSDPDFVSSLDNTLLIFFSDHGFRFGNIRYTYTGWLEERIPFIYFRFPKTFQKLFPKKYLNFMTNTERLTVPFDVFNTLQEILEIGNSTYTKQLSHGCQKCDSLFTVIPENRTCDDAGIKKHWCTCTGHTYMNPKGHVARIVSQFVVNEVNNLVKNSYEGQKCANYSINKVHSSGVSEPYINSRNQTVSYYLIMVETSPPAIFEASVEAYFDNDTISFSLLGDISRIDKYRSVTTCLNNNTLKKYCYCLSKWSYFKSFFTG